MHGAKRRRRRRWAKRGKAMPGTYHFRMERGLRKRERRSTAAQTAALYVQKLDFFFAHNPLCPPFSSFPYDFFVPLPVRRLPPTNLFFFLFSSSFFRRLVLAVRREGQGRAGGNGLETMERAKGRF